MFNIRDLWRRGSVPNSTGDDTDPEPVERGDEDDEPPEGGSSGAAVAIPAYARGRE